jgi:glutathione reductase (NADPH)
MKDQYDYDLLVIGGGSGGVRSARWAAALGAKVAICEDDRYGGTCVLRGCIPKKMMVYGAHFADDIETAKDFGWDISINSHDWKAFKQARDKELSRLSGLYSNMLSKNGVEVLQGKGVVTEANSVEVGGKKVTAKNIIIAVGGVPWRPQIEGYEHGINSDQFFELEERPKRVVVAGGGFIGVEFAGLLNHFGSEVQMIIRSPQILRGFDNEATAFLQESMKTQGIEVRSSTTIDKVVKKDDGTYLLNLSDETQIECDCIIVATGRIPKTEGLGLENAGVKVDSKGAICVNSFSQTNIPSIYAVGDVTNRVNLTPVALQEGMLVAENLFNGKTLKMTYDNIPSAVFSSPPLSTVGLTEEQCKDQNKEIEVFTSSFRPLKYTLGDRQIRTFMKMIVEKDGQKVIGLHMVGDDAPEIMQGFAVALKAGVTKEIFDQTIGIHPSSAEEYTTMRTPRS